MTNHDGVLADGAISHQEFHEVWATLRSAPRVVILTHANPDADAVASLLALKAVLEHHGQPVEGVVGDGALPDPLRFLPGADTLGSPDQIDIAQTDLLVTVDCADEMRVGPLYDEHPDWFDGSVPLVNIDHHVTNTRFGTTNLIDPEAAATCEVLTMLFLTVGITIDADLATCLLAGMQGDTLGLRTPSTTSRTLRISAELLDRGADLDTVVDHLFRVKPFSTIKLWGLVLNRAERLGDLVWTQITPEILAESEAVAAEGEGIVNFLAGTKGSRVAALLYEQPDGWRISLRSVREDVDVAELARLYGGGGHSRAAGCRIPPGTESRDRFLHDIATRVAAMPVAAT